MDGSGVVAHQIRELPLEQGRAAPGVVVGDGRIDVMAHMGGAEAVVEQVEQGSVGAIDGLQGALGPGPLVGGEVGDVGVGVLQPGVVHQPGIDHQVGQAVDAQHSGHGEVGGGQDQGQQHRQQPEVRLQHQGAEACGEQGPPAVAERLAVPEMGGGGAVVFAAGKAEHQIKGPAHHQVDEQGLEAKQKRPDPLGQVCQPPAGG